MSPMLKEILELTVAQENVDQVFRSAVRLMGLEDQIMLAKPDYLEAAESILSPMMAALENRYWPGSQELADIKYACDKLNKALEKAHEAEEQ